MVESFFDDGLLPLRVATGEKIVHLVQEGVVLFFRFQELLFGESYLLIKRLLFFFGHIIPFWIIRSLRRGRAYSISSL